MLVEGYKNFRLSDPSFHLPARLQGQNFCLGSDFRVLEKCSSPPSHLAMLKPSAGQPLLSPSHGMVSSMRKTTALSHGKGIEPE